ncbi:kinase [Fluviispira multicolorata]|uniref:Kinase n=1 Tax=Fluviispira multicolorata TaxID=2654512 RepID=A0A833JHQ1_9BACT|nr:kinase [Fluviispira multicolorata]KAB8033512.1 kinase [Fluviispira multicolorata]
MKTFEEILETKRRGSLKIILGYAAGVGKTYAMLNEAHRLKQRGFDVVIAYIEPHRRPETQALLAGLEQVPLKTFNVGDKTFTEMDVDAVISRQPQIVLVDELAHTNIVGSKNTKRFLDVLEILNAEINVITTLNVQHLESIADRVVAATKAPVHERIPDKVLQFAQQIVMADISMEDLRERLRLGKVYEKDKADNALANFFSYNNLAFLREICLREAAGNQYQKMQENEFSENYAIAEEAVMVALSSDPNNAPMLIRKGTKLASRLSSRVFVTYVQKKSEDPAHIDSQLQRKIQQNFDLATKLGAEVKILYGEKISDILVNFAIDNKIRHAVFGKSRLTPIRERLRGSILLEFIHDAAGVDVHIINVESGGKIR